MRRYIKLYEVKESYQTEIDNKTLEFPNICLIDNEEQREMVYNPPRPPQIRYTTTDGVKLQFHSDYLFISNEWDEDLQCFVMYMNSNFSENSYSNFGYSNINTLKSIEFIEFENINSLSSGFLNGCSNLEYANLNGLKNITHIPDGFCANCSKLETVDMKQLVNLTTIGRQAFVNCVGLKKIIFSNLLKKLIDIYDGFCQGCTELESIDLAPFSNLISFQCLYFLNGCTGLTSLDLSPFNKSTYINAYFLNGCTGLKNIDFSKLTNISSIGINFLDGCTRLTSLDLSSMTKLSAINDGFLADCTSITSLKITFIPASNTFNVIQQLTELYIINENDSFEEKFSIMFNDYDVQDDLKIYVHASQYDKYISNCPDHKKHFYVYSTPEARPQMRYTIIDDADSNSVLSAVKSEFGEDNVINDYFDGKTSEYVVEISDNVSTLPALKIDEIITAKFLNFYNIDTIDNKFFESCDNILKLDLSGITHITNIGHWFLKDCSNLENIILPNLQYVETVGSMFMKSAAINKDIDTIDLSSMINVETLDAEFLGCTKFKNIILPQQSKLKTLPSAFLINCENIKTVDLSLLSNCTSIGSSFLSGTASLETLDLTPLSNVQQIFGAFLSYTSSLTEIDLQPLRNYTGGGIIGSLQYSSITKVIVYNLNSNIYGIISPILNSIKELYITDPNEKYDLSSYFIDKISQINVYVSKNQYSSYLETYPDMSERLFIYDE